MEINLHQQQLKPLVFFNAVVVSPWNTHSWDELCCSGSIRERFWDQRFPQVSLEVPGELKDAQSWNSLAGGASSLDVLKSRGTTSVPTSSKPENRLV